MTTPDSPDSVEQQALAWAVRFPLEAGEERGLEAWLAGDRRRQGALTRALAAWSMLDRAHAACPADWADLPDAMADDAETTPATPRSWLHRRLDRRIVIGAMGGGLAATLGGIIAPTFRSRHLEATAIGEVRRLPLQDGSLATINTDSAIRVALARDMRKIDLVHGEAWFNVAKDPQRPFVVKAGEVQVRAVGTAFSVRRVDNVALVSVTEGVVSAWGGDQADRAVFIKMGEQARIGPDGLIGMVDSAPERIDRALAWRNGEISLRDETLGDAIEEFNRYNSRKIVLEDPVLRQERLVGLFQTNDPDRFAQTVALTYDLDVMKNEEVIQLARK